ncbi:hypothetical protein EPO05_01550 [Patescibacteria group bacterium]|nr:MAG: hypothetical protein EPO05_01550 [Patescibacteria group bacterium]
MMLHEIGVVFVAAALMGLLFYRFKQPLIPAFVLAGVLVGPLVLNWVHNAKTISELAEVSVAMLLFLIGTEMDLSRLKEQGLIVILGGTLQVAVTFAVGFGVAILFGFSSVAACYLGFVLAFSSTMLVVKILGDRGKLSTVFGRITVGILVIQDIYAIFALSLLGMAGKVSLNSVLVTLTATAGTILIIVLLAGRLGFPRLLRFVSLEKELLILTILGSIFVGGFYAESVQLSLGIGAFLVGLALSNLIYTNEIVGDLKPLKAFFTPLFFASLGLMIAPETASPGPDLLILLSKNIGLIVVFSVLALVVKPLSIMGLVGMFGYTRNDSFGTGVSLGQLSEFGLILVAHGIAVKHLEAELLPVMVIVVVGSMAASSYVIKYSSGLFYHLKGLWGWTERLSLVKKGENGVSTQVEKFSPEFVLVGCDRLGGGIEAALRESGFSYAVFDSDPAIFEKLVAKGVRCYFGDVENEEVLESVGWKNVKAVFSSAPGHHINEVLAAFLHRVAPETNLVPIVRRESLVKILYDKGAHLVLHVDALAAFGLMNESGPVTLANILNNPEKIRELGKELREKDTSVASILGKNLNGRHQCNASEA